MKKICRILIPTLCLSMPTIVLADDGMESNTPKYLKNLGAYLGFDIQNAPSNDTAKPPASYQFLNTSLIEGIPQALFNAFMSALPITSSSASLQIVPSTATNLSILNAYANNVFKNPAYNSASNNQQGTLSISALIDQQNYQQDPVSQAVMNILGTPDYSYCITTDNNNNPMPDPNCAFKSQAQVMQNVIGPIPSTNAFFSSSNGGGINPSLLSELNTNTLLGPLMYATDSSNSGDTNQNQNSGLSAQSQAQQAANFVRYAAALVTPISLPTKSAYDALYAKTITVPSANNPSGKPTLAQSQAQSTLAKYLANLRVYASQNSVGIGNLYYMLAKRMPQIPPGSPSGTQASSQALNEFQMASWRVLNLQSSNKPQWIEQINNASPATVQKEIAALLAEINYQLYLGRMQDERLLLTQSILLLQNSRSTEPDPNFGATTESSQ